ncbi:hypothetical protein GQ55_4G301000 [Panicum hallii var. hallii]|uniref:Uncharacterized protein n=1 Tax=Panicum hallii var. hallii TaxID=1504633 RepID=A0A2T7E1L5_9POAL|nr:hypothetical protein GQ55_4G301000 [Panicum hallii var. hallii]
MPLVQPDFFVRPRDSSLRPPLCSRFPHRGSTLRPPLCSRFPPAAPTKRPKMVPRRRGIEIRGRWLEACPAVCGRKLVGARRRAPGAGRSGRWRSSGSGVGGLRGRRRDLARSTGPAQDAEVKERRRWRLQLGNTAGTRSRRGAGMVYLPPPTGLVHPRPREFQQVWFITRPRQFLQLRVRTSSSSSRGIMDRGVHMVREDFDRQVLQQRESMDHRLKTNREDTRAVWSAA